MKIRMAVVTLCGMALLSASMTGFAQNASDSGAMVASSAAPASNNKAANRKLAKDVRRALSRTKDVSVANINVRALNGVVTLAGTVPDESQIDKATKSAQGVAGVTSVKNALTIRPVGQ
ncbi:BON domain-containing protein [Caballeronia sp. TF1N1]|uniref:BON domain-containing protein n=1 Tax=Caballeronia sp. TF1N1 TaxID=2878153 RepID=UPI001FD35F0F|nr:BON domain-containing protein [Caballeronia sp. TF1N1]